jgi:small multidrug resistance pump
MHLLYLFLAIGFEVTGTTALKFSNGFSKPVPSTIMIVAYIISFFTMSQALKKIDIGTAYAIWSGLGTALIATIGILWFKEPLSMMKIGSIALIILGVIGLNLGGAS